MGTAAEDLTLEQLTLCIKEVEHNQVRSILHRPLYQTQKSKSEEVHRDERQSGVIAKGGVRAFEGGWGPNLIGVTGQVLAFFSQSFFGLVQI